METKLNITKGINDKPAVTELLIQQLKGISGLDGQAYIGYPLIPTPEGRLTIDATLIVPEKGLILLDLVEGTELGDYSERQDDIANKLEAKLKMHRELLRGRNLLVDIHVITFAPAISNLQGRHQDDYPLANTENFANILAGLSTAQNGLEVYAQTISAIENLSNLRKSRIKREILRSDSRGAKLKKLEERIATLDPRQNQAVLESVDGVQRIRGLAGSGKTIVLALKAAYLHIQNPSWRIAVTFQTRSLKAQFQRLINTFCIEQSGEEPNWTKLRVINAWGASGGDDRDGIYYEFSCSAGVDFFDFRSAAQRFGGANNAFNGACRHALKQSNEKQANTQIYDLILVDEAQDFKPSFLQVCYSLLKEPKRLVYAYDELQNLSGESMPPPEEIFGIDAKGEPLVSFAAHSSQDIILEKCYRNSRPTLVTAHALGFGIYRTANQAETGLVQMFDNPSLWKEIGYEVTQGKLESGQFVILERSNFTSPDFLENHSDVDDLIIFKKFESYEEQKNWLVNEIKNNLERDELRHDDIVVISPDPLTARNATAPMRQALFELGIQNHLAGVDTDSDIFFKTDTDSITFSGIYRAKGNEAGMVYVVNAHKCTGSGTGLATLRNRLFTAITRSKAWVRVVGFGDEMQELIDEFEKLKREKFRLNFTYPNEGQLSKLRLVHRDLSPEEQRKLEQKKNSAEQLAKALQSGELLVEDLPDDIKEILRTKLGG